MTNNFKRLTVIVYVLIINRLSAFPLGDTMVGKALRSFFDFSSINLVDVGGYFFAGLIYYLLANIVGPWLIGAMLYNVCEKISRCANQKIKNILNKVFTYVHMILTVFFFVTLIIIPFIYTRTPMKTTVYKRMGDFFEGESVILPESYDKMRAFKHHDLLVIQNAGLDKEFGTFDDIVRIKFDKKTNNDSIFILTDTDIQEVESEWIISDDLLYSQI